MKSAGAWKQLSKRAFTAPRQARVGKRLTPSALARLQTYDQTIHHRKINYRPPSSRDFLRYSSLHPPTSCANCEDGD